MPAAQEPDELLMAQVARGQREPMEPLVRRYAQPLVSFLARMTGDAHKAEELFQEAFLAVWRKRAQYESPRPFKPWLYTIALNICRADIRAAKPAMAPLQPAMAPAGGNSPAAVALAIETAARVARAVDSLPPQQRAVVAMRVWDGLSYGEIAEVVGRTEATVRSHMSHGLAALRQALVGCVD